MTDLIEDLRSQLATWKSRWKETAEQRDDALAGIRHLRDGFKAARSELGIFILPGDTGYEESKELDKSLRHAEAILAGTAPEAGDWIDLNGDEAWQIIVRTMGRGLDEMAAKDPFQAQKYFLAILSGVLGRISTEQWLRMWETCPKPCGVAGCKCHADSVAVWPSLTQLRDSILKTLQR